MQDQDKGFHTSNEVGRDMKTTISHSETLTNMKVIRCIPYQCNKLKCRCNIVRVLNHCLHEPGIDKMLDLQIEVINSKQGLIKKIKLLS